MNRRRLTWRQRLARRLDPTITEWAVTRMDTPAPPAPEDDTEDIWPEICEQFALRVLAAAYQMGSHLDAMEGDEQDPDRLERLYRIDHANTRIRRHAENLQVLLGRRIEEADQQTVALLDVVRAATSAIEYYPRVQIGHVVDLAVVEFAADDVIRVLTELLDNATRFSPPTASVVVSAYITEEGSVLLRIEDVGLGIPPDQLASLNGLLTGTVPAPVAVNPAAHLGLVVVSRLAMTNHLRVRLTSRPNGGTTATVAIPGSLLCEMPHANHRVTARATVEPTRPVRAPHRSPDRETAYQGGSPTTSRLTLINGHPGGDDRSNGTREPGTGGRTLPRRVRESLRGDENGVPGAPPVPPVPQPRTFTDAGSDRDAWPDETAAFAAGVQDAQLTISTEDSEGHLG
ncbi:MAG TPA: ATP-binding protein [Micromonosporaceae bacterium]